MGTFFRPFPLGPPFESLSAIWLREKSQSQDTRLQTLGFPTARPALTRKKTRYFMFADQEKDGELLNSEATIKGERQEQKESFPCHGLIKMLLIFSE